MTVIKFSVKLARSPCMVLVANFSKRIEEKEKEAKKVK